MSQIATMHVAASTLRPNPWNPNVQSPFMFDKALASIREFGFVDPVTVRVVSGTEGYEIVDGEHRWRAACKLGIEQVAIVNLGEIPDHVAKRLTVVLNETRGEANVEKISDLIKSLVDEDRTLVNVLPYTAHELQQFLALSTPAQASSADAGGATDAHWSLRLKGSSARLETVQRAVTLARRLLSIDTDAAALVAVCKDYIERESKPSA